MVSGIIHVYYLLCFTATIPGDVVLGCSQPGIRCQSDLTTSHLYVYSEI